MEAHDRRLGWLDICGLKSKWTLELKFLSSHFEILAKFTKFCMEDGTFV